VLSVSAFLVAHAQTGTASALIVSAPSSATAGTPITVNVSAEDPSGNIITDYAGTVYFASSDREAVLPSNSTLTNGVGTFSVTLESAGSQFVSAMDTVNNSITGTSASITVTGTASTLVVSAPSSATIGTAITVNVTAEDAKGNIVTGYTGTVYFASTDTQAALPSNSTLTNGVGTFSVTLKTAGSQTISATDTVNSSITGTSASITVAITPTPTPTSSSTPTLTQAVPEFSGSALGLVAVAIAAAALCAVVLARKKHRPDAYK